MNKALNYTIETLLSIPVMFVFTCPVIVTILDIL